MKPAIKLAGFFEVTMNSFLKLDNLSLTYHTKNSETIAIQGLEFSVEKGEFVAIIGPSGCGKTSILSLVAGLIKKSCGTITLCGKEITTADDNVGYMLQRDQLFPWLTIEKNVILPLIIKNIKTVKNVDYTYNLLKKYGLYEFRKYYPDQLSGGMRQRAALIRTLSSKPELLLLDEPFSALDYQTRLLVCDDVYKVIKSEKKTALLVTHDISEAISLADKIIVLTKRPAKVKKVYYTDFDKSATPLLRREEKNFSTWFEILWKELNKE